MKQEVLKLREDPQIAADLAAAFTRSNGAYLQEKFGRMPSPGELYIAHFLGAQGAEKLFKAGLADPDQIGRAAVPQAGQGQPRPSFTPTGRRAACEMSTSRWWRKHDAATRSGRQLLPPSSSPTAPQWQVAGRHADSLALLGR